MKTKRGGWEKEVWWGWEKRGWKLYTDNSTRKPYGFMQSSFWVIMVVHVMVSGD